MVSDTLHRRTSPTVERTRSGEKRGRRNEPDLGYDDRPVPVPMLDRHNTVGIMFSAQ